MSREEARVKTISLPVFGLNNATCGQIIERRVGALPGVTRVDASYVTQSVTIAYDERQINEQTLRAQVTDCGFACGEEMTTTQTLHASAQRQRATAPTPAHDDMGRGHAGHAAMAQESAAPATTPAMSAQHGAHEMASQPEAAHTRLAPRRAHASMAQAPQPLPARATTPTWPMARRSRAAWPTT